MRLVHHQTGRSAAALLTSRRLARSPRVITACAHAASSTSSLLESVATLHAVGLQGLIQSVRDTSQAAFGGVLGIAINFSIGAALYAATNAWRAGGRFREVSSEVELRERDFSLLFLCLALDLFGIVGSVLFGEGTDLIWAPISALVLKSLFRSDAIALLDLGKEVLPFTDVLPVASLAWLLAVAFPDSSPANALGISLDRGSSDGEDPEDLFDPGMR